MVDCQHPYRHTRFTAPSFLDARVITRAHTALAHLKLGSEALSVRYVGPGWVAAAAVGFAGKGGRACAVVRVRAFVHGAGVRAGGGAGSVHMHVVHACGATSTQHARAQSHAHAHSTPAPSGTHSSSAWSTGGRMRAP